MPFSPAFRVVTQRGIPLAVDWAMLLSGGGSDMIQVDVYRLDRQLVRSFESEAAALYATLSRFADRPVDTLASYVLGDVSVMRVDLGRNGFAVLEHLA